MSRNLVILITVIFMVTFLNISVLAESNYKPIWFNGSRIHIIETNAHLTSVHFTLKGHSSGINCSYFNMNTRKTVKPGDYNRPFIIFKDNEIVFSDNKADLVGQEKVASGGSWILRNGKPYSTSDHFSKDFKRMVVPRTCIGIKGDKVYLIATKKANFARLEKLGLKLGLDSMINLDGGTSTMMKYNGKIILSGKRPVVNYVTAE